MPATLAPRAPVSIDRRRFPRFTLPVAYTPIDVRLLHGKSFALHGHVYDISEGGLRFELDKPIPQGARIAMRITLPDWADGRSGTTSRPPTVLAFGTIVWIEDEDEPGPVKMAAVIDEFCRAADRERLLSTFASGRYRMAA
jgi:hypothetical protein